MKSTETHTAARLSPRQRRRGTSSLEVLVAFTLLTTVLGVATPLVVRHGRLLTAHRQYRLALDELSNQLERLTALPEAELLAAVEQLTASDFAAARLPGVELKGELAPDDLGTCVTLRISWDEPQRREAPLSLSAWVMPGPTQADGPPMEGEKS